MRENVSLRDTIDVKVTKVYQQFSPNSSCDMFKILEDIEQRDQVYSKNNMSTMKYTSSCTKVPQVRVENFP